MKNYEKTLQKVEKLVAKSLVALYERTKLLVEVSNDREFLHDQQQAGLVPSVTLSRFLADCQCDFAFMTQLLKMFPEQEKWETGNLNDMRLALVKSLRKPPKGRDTPDGTVHSYKQKYVDLLKENESLKTEIVLLRQENIALRDRMNSMQETIDLISKKTKKPTKATIS